MKLAELLVDETVRRREFPVCERGMFLAHAGVAPLPRRVVQAMEDYLEAAARDDQEDVLAEEVVGETRQLAAQLIGARAEEIAFVGSTSMGLAMVAAGLAWRAGDNVVCYREDYPANVYPWMDLAARGVEVRYVEPRVYGNVTALDLERVVDSRTRLVALASAHFVSGWRLDVDAIGRFLQARDVRFCLDGIQTWGALRTSVRYVDFAAADAHKWLLGPLGAAILFVKRERFPDLHPALVGWHSAPCPGFAAQAKLDFWPDARRYEPGSLNLVGIVGLRAALQLVLELGIEPIETRVLTLAQRVIAGATQQGFTVVGPMARSGLSGIVTLDKPGTDMGRLFQRLRDANVITSLRVRHDGRRCLRISAHGYNSEKELDFLVAHLAEGAA